MRMRLLACLVVIAVTPVLAQGVMQVQRPPVIQQIPSVQQDSGAVQKVMTLEDAQAQIARLRAEKRDLTAKLNDSDARLNETLATLEQWTSKGGSLVHAYCENESLSQRTDGSGQEDCAASGYTCSPAEGTCHRSCNVTTECAYRFVCATDVHTCVPNG